MKSIQQQFHLSDYQRTLRSALDWLTERQKESGLYINKNKTEQYLINRVGDPDWKKLKYLGSLLKSEYDIK